MKSEKLTTIIFILMASVIMWGVLSEVNRDAGIVYVERIADKVIELVEVIEQGPYFIFPIHEDDFIWDGKGGDLTSAYGERDPWEIGGLGDDYHDGLDSWGVSHVGTWHARIVAVAGGVVKDHWLNHPVCGKMITILHDDGSESSYAHLSKSFVHEKRVVNGELVPWRVEQGEVIGRQGNTGLSKGTLVYSEHLHFELRIDGKLVNPLKYIEVPVNK